MDVSFAILKILGKTMNHTLVEKKRKGQAWHAWTFYLESIVLSEKKKLG
jgi:hypothetical protein